MSRLVEIAIRAGIDILWLGARTTANPFAVQEISDALAGTDVTVLIKNPVNPDPELWLGAVERLMNSGITNVAVVHRGFSTYEKGLFRNLPHWHIPIELKRRGRIMISRDIKTIEVNITIMNICLLETESMSPNIIAMILPAYPV